MLCKKPFRRGVFEFGCGQCLPCRFNRRRIWTHRILLESFQEKPCSFVTLTYSDDKIPHNGSLNPAHTEKWLKRLRRAVAPTTLRYFLVGEYGDESQRPHYHVALFGIGPCLFGGSWLTGKQCVCNNCKIVSQTWGFGGVSCDNLEPESAAYIAGYVTKKMTSTEDSRLFGRHPEFARMSTKPGIGALAIDDVSSVLRAKNISEELVGSVTSLRHGLKQMPLGRYLKEKLREEFGLSFKRVKRDVADGVSFQVEYESFPKWLSSVRFRSQVQMQELRKEGPTSAEKKQRLRNFEVKQGLWKKRKLI